MPSTDAITVYRGEDVTLNFTMSPVEDVSGWSLLFTVRIGQNVVISKAGSVDDGPNGQFSFALADTDTEGERLGEWLYDVWRDDPGAERILAIGTFTLKDTARDVDA